MELRSTFELRLALKKVKFLIFDFDGTLVDSNAIKLAGFDALFSEHLAHWEKIREYCYSNHHTSRGEKFRYVYEQILQRPYNPSIDDELHKRYADATTQKVVEAPEIPGAERFLKEMKKSHTLELLSATLDPILQTIVETKKWRAYFDQVVGSPINKTQWLRDFCTQRKIPAGEAWFIGDTREDASAALRANIPFLGVRLPDDVLSAIGTIQDFNGLLE